MNPHAKFLRVSSHNLNKLAILIHVKLDYISYKQKHSVASFIY